ncbi:hypothetical protein Bca52824_075876 [Brassica carinata]|uniref:Uncharacterized protein n=1 Tax=Brassica carinata TaxID=52824 RepID=A0A8X7PSZ6_BRACI|nr:hypothetical protein Bca52824_075876 [Brassica carinata]
MNLSKLFLFGLYGLPFLNLGEFLIIQVSKDIKYADKQPIIPWGPRYSKSSRNEMLINLSIATVFSAWIAIQRSVEYKPLLFMSFVFMYRIFEKLKSFEAPSSPTLTLAAGGRGRKWAGIENGKEASSAYTGILNVIEYMSSSIPHVSMYI